MARSITFEFDTDPQVLLQNIYDSLTAEFPGWQPARGNLDVALSEAYANLVADLTDLAASVPDSIFRYFGSSLMGLDPIEAIPAITTTTWTARDVAGHTVEAGTQIMIPDSSGTPIPFEVVNTVIIPPGSSATAAGAVTIQAINPGADTSGLGGAGASVQLIDLLDWVLSITMVAATTGGQDAEADDTYLDRLRSELQLLSPRPIIPSDFAVLARTIAGVSRALAIDGFIPPASYGQERAVAVAAIDAAGLSVSTPIKNAIDAYLQSLREVNFIVSVIDPTYTIIDVDVIVKVSANASAPAVHDAIVATVQDWLSPANWGRPTDGSANDWELAPVVRYMKLAQLIEDVIGVDYITTTAGAFNLRDVVQGGVLARLDIALSGAAPLTQPGNVTVTTV